MKLGLGVMHQKIERVDESEYFRSGVSIVYSRADDDCICKLKNIAFVVCAVDLECTDCATLILGSFLDGFRHSCDL